MKDKNNWYDYEAAKELDKFLARYPVNFEEAFIKSYENECYQDLEDRRLWTLEETMDRLIFLAHEIGNDMKLGEAIRKELEEYDKRR